MKKVLLTIVVVVLAAVYLLLAWHPAIKVQPFRAPEDKIFTGFYIDGYNYILKFSSAIDLSIYQYRVNSNDEIYGKRTDYTFSGKYYNHLFGNVYFYPEFTLLFWKNFLISDGLDYARIHMDAQRNWALNARFEPTYGGFTDEVRQIDDVYIRMGPISFSAAEGEELELAEKVIAAFEKDGIDNK